MNGNLSELDTVNEIIAQESVFQSMSHQQLVDRCGELLYQANKNYRDAQEARDLANKNALELSRLEELLINIQHVLSVVNTNADMSKDYTHSMKRTVFNLQEKLIHSIQEPVRYALERLSKHQSFRRHDIPF